MGMMIENSIETLTSILDEATESEDSVCYVTSADAEALKLAIDTMRKYQKIQEIVTKWHYDPRMKMTTSYYYMAKITEVLEDGNDD